MISSRSHRLADERGQAIVETGIVIVLLVTLSMGIVEFGRAFMIVNMITHAARAGARAAAVAPPSNRDTSGNILDFSSYETLVDGEIRSVLGPDTDNLAITAAQATTNGVPVVSVNVAGTLPFIFNLVTDEFDVNRTVTFRDEGK